VRNNSRQTFQIGCGNYSIDVSPKNANIDIDYQKQSISQGNNTLKDFKNVTGMLSKLTQKLMDGFQ